MSVCKIKYDWIVFSEGHSTLRGHVLLTIHTFMFVDFRAHRHAHAISPAWIQAPVHFSKGCLVMG